MLPYVERHGFTFFSNYLGNDFLVIESARIDEIFRYSKAEEITNFWVSSLRGFDEQNLESLRDFDIKRIIVDLDSIKDVSVLNTFSGILFLRLFSDPIDQELDFANFPLLERFEGWWCKNLHNLFASKNLHHLALWKYKSRTMDLQEFAGLANLQSLALIQSNFKSLAGIEKLRKLKSLSLAYCKNLEEINSAASRHVLMLEELEIEVCKKLQLQSLQALPKLKVLELLNNGKYETLQAVLDRLPLLEDLNFSQTDLIDGDNSYLVKHPHLKQVYFLDKRHYKLSCEKVNEILQR